MSLEDIKGIYHGYMYIVHEGGEGRPETTKLSHVNTTNYN